MSLIKYLGGLGYGSRREVTVLIAARRLTRTDGSVVRDGDAWTHAELRVDGQPLDPAPGSVIMLHKPVGYVCSTQDQPPLVYELLPARWLRRRPVMATVGRLDRETSGLLLLTDDGALNHRLTSPRTHQAKTYRVELSDDLRGDEAATFAAGTLLLKGEDAPLAAASLVVVGPRLADLTVTEGRYHQVRRMFAAVGNHVVTLHRTVVASLTVDGLAPGAWRLLTSAETDRLRR